MTAMTTRLLIVEDDAALNQMLRFHFEDRGCEVKGVGTCRDALQVFASQAFDLVLLDQQLPDGTGVELLAKLRDQEPDLPVMMMTGQHDLELAIEAIKMGAAEFVHKPIRTEQLQGTVDRLLENRRLTREVAAHPTAPQPLGQPRELIGRSNAMLAVSKEIALSAGSAANVLITGESGTGKEVVARLIHLHSGRTGPFVALNCAAIVDTLTESELFGHEKGAFTGAVSRKQGKFELAQDGTLFLDEIGELAIPLQAKLLRALQERVFERVGGTQPISTNARVITATNRDLLEEVATGRFREDLLYRLNVISVHLPPLRERKEDIPLLTAALMGKIARQIQKPVLTLTEQSLDKLMAYSWPGNVRELENLLTQALVHARGNAVTPDLLTLPTSAAPDNTPPTGERPAIPADGGRILRTLDDVEAAHIQEVLELSLIHI